MYESEYHSILLSVAVHPDSTHARYWIMTKTMHTTLESTKANTKHRTIERSMIIVATRRTGLNMSFHCRLNPLSVSSRPVRSCEHEETRADDTDNAANCKQG